MTGVRKRAFACALPEKTSVMLRKGAPATAVAASMRKCAWSQA